MNCIKSNTICQFTSKEGKIMETDGQIMDYHSVLDEILKDIDGFKIRPFLLQCLILLAKGEYRNGRKRILQTVDY